jgi:hypothetical protein
MDSGAFYLEIYKDEDCTQFIAKLEKDVVRVTGDSLAAGFVSDMSMSPLISTVQVSSMITVGFTTSHSLYPGAKV